jgi:hypothetical protein
MKTIIISTLALLLLASPSHAASCADTQNAANTAVKERNENAKSAINTTMPDPEDTRGPFSGCLDSIHSIGDVFTLGVSFPSMDQIVAGMCNQVDSMIQEKMHEVLSEVRSTVNEIGNNNPFQVSGSGANIGINISGKLK